MISNVIQNRESIETNNQDLQNDLRNYNTSLNVVLPVVQPEQARNGRGNVVIAPRDARTRMLENYDPADGSDNQHSSMLLVLPQ